MNTGRPLGVAPLIQFILLVCGVITSKIPLPLLPSDHSYRGTECLYLMLFDIQEDASSKRAASPECRLSRRRKQPVLPTDHPRPQFSFIASTVCISLFWTLY